MPAGTPSPQKVAFATTVVVAVGAVRENPDTVTGLPVRGVDVPGKVNVDVE